jgi:hypothetical protein
VFKDQQKKLKKEKKPLKDFIKTNQSLAQIQDLKAKANKHLEKFTKTLPTTPNKSKSRSPRALKPKTDVPSTNLKKKSPSPMNYTSPYSLKAIKKQTMAPNDMILLSHRSQGSKGRTSLDSRGSSAGTRSDHLSFGNQSKDARFSMTQSLQKTPISSQLNSTAKKKPV